MKGNHYLVRKVKTTVIRKALLTSSRGSVLLQWNPISLRFFCRRMNTQYTYLLVVVVVFAYAPIKNAYEEHAAR